MQSSSERRCDRGDELIGHGRTNAEGIRVAQFEEMLRQSAARPLVPGT